MAFHVDVDEDCRSMRQLSSQTGQFEFNKVPFGLSTSREFFQRYVSNAFTKFTWLYPVKTVSAENALEKLKLQQKTFGNPVRIITDRGSAFTSKELFNDYCTEENIQHLP
ncbi:integrase catalytic domain-containing protein [Trichonephila inaurata madagascariensis]|uniref:Integrase catalytic domain-containing protein n=1 Tax=Trichonephila inaurata madagascariensis TaxID=2747483 RepID=A0A8X7BQ17_9ARAC|nr:integrase catalytic domain-containing protein [Trichonephila inaurata madagascariensis]